ncbi:MAG: hypothetical protein KIS66_16255 [Fimbriimonadaceae bacterium]|nr:hypothetical protein [Fimbriimonadaceae bacterium]
MTLNEFQAALYWGMAICAVMVFVSLLRVRKLGASAYVQATSYVVMGFLLYLVQAGYPQPWLIGAGVVLFALFVLDFAVRAGGPRSK